MLALDETASMTPSDMVQLRNAAQAFVNQLNPNLTNPRTNQIGLAQFQGQICPSGAPAPCQPDAHVLTNLTADPTVISQLIGGPAGGCPALPAQPSGFAPLQGNTVYACPLRAIGGSGSYLRSGLAVLFGTSPPWDLWSTGRGGRANGRKVLVLESDGINNVPPLTGAQANANSVSYASTVKLGADQVGGTADDVEIYTVGFYGGGESGLVGGATPLCPANTLPAGHTSTDDMMIAMSSSTAGTCDHYYPQAKSASLQPIFIAIANAINH
jgi:hypothetical protein